MDQNHHSHKCLYECFINVITPVYKQKTLTSFMFSFYAPQPEHLFQNVSVEKKSQ